MDRIVGIETEYGCLLSHDEARGNCELWPTKVKNYLFQKARAGTIDLHYRDYEEPPGNGGFLLNGGRLYLDMGHIEYASPECLHLHDLVTFEMAGDELLRSSLVALDANQRVSFIKNNVDHHTGATFGCHENYLMKREAHVSGHASNFYRRGSRRAGEPARVRLRAAATGNASRFSTQPAR
jgi:proteasome accessory factor A